MKNYVDKLSSLSNYHLYAIASHHGNDVDSGHFTASCKSIKDDKWHLFNDENVSEIHDLDTNSKEVYLLFYSNADYPRSEYKNTILNAEYFFLFFKV